MIYTHVLNRGERGFSLRPGVRGVRALEVNCGFARAVLLPMDSE